MTCRALFHAALTACSLVTALPVAAADRVVVFAAASLKEALDDIAERFTSETGTAVTTSYAASSALARQIEFGAPADIFISANTDWMNHLAHSGAITPATRIDLVGNHLVLIAPATSDLAIDLTAPTDLTALLHGGKLAMALTTAVPAGIYGKAALENLGMWDAVAASVAETDNVRAAMALVALGAAPLGIVYSTDAKAEPRVRIIAHFPDASHPDIRYPAAVTTQSQSAKAASFLDYLQSTAADEVFTHYGFKVKAE